MAEKKKIKIQTPTEAMKDEKEAEEVVTEDKRNPEHKAEKKDLMEVDDPVKNLEARLQSKEEEAQETYDRLLRVSAEFENYKKRSAREMEEFRKFANQALIKEMLSVVDNLELAMNSTDSPKAIDKGLLEGLEMTHREILKVFEKFDVKPIDSKGRPFDPMFHEAVMQEETDKVPESTVVNELQRGYLIHDRLLRPAMVVVAKPKEKKGAQSPNDNEKKNDTQ